MKERRFNRRQLVRSSLVVLLAMLLALSPLSGLGVTAEAVEVEAVGVEALQEWQPGWHPVTFSSNLCPLNDGVFMVPHGEPIGWDNLGSLLENQPLPIAYLLRGFVVNRADGHRFFVAELDQVVELIVEETLHIETWWERNDPDLLRHLVTFNFNGGYVEGFLESIRFCVPHELPIGSYFLQYVLSNLHRPGYNFIGWCWNGGWIEPGSVLYGHREMAALLLGSSIEFTAIWEPEPIMHRVYVNFNGGQNHTGASSHTLYVSHGSAMFWLVSDFPTRPGYVLSGWYLEGSGILENWQMVIPRIVEGPLLFFAMWESDGNAPCADTNLARAATMSASSEEPARPAVRANNGVREGAVTNSWSATTPGQEWLMVDFGELVNFNHIRIFQGGNRIADYRFEYSEDGVNWTTFRSGARIMEAVPAAHYSFTTDATIQARYVRLFSGRSFGVLPIVVFEFEVFYMP